MSHGLQDWLVSPRGPIRREKVAPNGAFARWQDHRARFVETGLWPVILSGGLEGLEEIYAGQAAGVEDDVAMALNLDVQDFFSGALETYREDDEEGELDFDFDPAGLARETKPPITRQIASLNELLKEGAKAEVWIVLVPCREPWEVPAVLSYGGWNDCPMPAEHVAVWREWHTRHGAEPLVIGGDVVELLVRPIESPMEAKRTAIEQFAYCADIVDQGVGSVESLASVLLGASVWFFWWD